MIIGLTGLIGSGKSEVAAAWEKVGAKIISGDAIGREVVENDSIVFYRLLMEFGPTIIDKNKRLNRRELGRLAFSSRQATELLNSIVHPSLLKRLDAQITQARLKGYQAVVDAALLIYWHYHKKMDCTVLVSSTVRNRFNRLLDRGFTMEEIRVRTKSQLPYSYLRKHADYVITNNKDLNSLRKRAQIIYSELVKKG
jgi:dephospho-CoA kinase